MKKWWNSFLYGSSRTRKYLWFVLLFLVAGMACLFAALVYSSLIWAAAGIGFCLFDVFVVRSTKFEEAFHEGREKSRKEKTEKERKEEPEEEAGKKLDDSAKDLLDGIKKEIEESESHTEFFRDYGEGRLRELKRLYHVGKAHKTIMIDSCPLYHVKQCPAYAWLDKGKLMLLLLEEEPRTLSVSLEEIDGIYYEANVLVGKMSDYHEFTQDSIVSSIFAAHLPDVQEKTIRSLPGFYKNLYVFGPGIRVTNTSVKNLFEFLKTDFKLEDEIMNAGKYDRYLKAAYKAQVLWKDHVIDTKEYQSRIKTIVSLKVSDTSTEAEFREYLTQMLDLKIITKEYAAYAVSIWKKEYPSDP